MFQISLNRFQRDQVSDYPVPLTAWPASPWGAPTSHGLVGISDGVRWCQMVPSSMDHSQRGQVWNCHEPLTAWPGLVLSGTLETLHLLRVPLKLEKKR